MEKKINKCLDKISSVFAYIAGILLGIMTFIVFLELCVRGLGKPITATTEITSFLFPWVVGFSALPVTREGMQMALSIVTDRIKGKAKQIVVIISNSIVIWFAVTMLVGGIKLSVILRADRLPISGFSKASVYSAIVLAFVGILADYIMKTIGLITSRNTGEAI